MGFLKTIGDYFRSGSGDSTQPIDSYGVLAPLSAATEYVETTSNYLKVFLKTNQVSQLLSRNVAPPNSYQEKALAAYKQYVHGLSSHDQSMERQSTLSTIVVGLEAIKANLELIEDNFSDLLGEMVKTEDGLRASALFIIGYIETANAFCAWVGYLTAHIAPDDSDVITPYWTKELIVNAKNSGEFVSSNLLKWSPRYKGLLATVADMKKHGTDVAIKSGDAWIDQFLHDNQFSFSEQNLMTAALRNPILAYVMRRELGKQEKIELLSTRREWLISKIAMEDAKIAGTDPNSPSYKKLKKAIDHYAKTVTQYEQKIERMRA